MLVTCTCSHHGSGGGAGGGCESHWRVTRIPTSGIHSHLSCSRGDRGPCEGVETVQFGEAQSAVRRGARGLWCGGGGGGGGRMVLAGDGRH